LVPGPTSGYTPAIVVHPTDRFTVYYIDGGYLGNYLQKSINGGITWFDASSGLPRYETPQSLAIDPNDGETLFLGTNGGYLQDREWRQVLVLRRSGSRECSIDRDCALGFQHDLCGNRAAWLLCEHRRRGDLV
jgi:hypothetical protein